MNLIKNIALMFSSTLLMMVVAELGIRQILGHPLEVSGFNKRVMLFEAVPNFKNEGNLFKYHPNARFKSTTFYVDPDKKISIKEYESIIKTNNLGLVQLNNIPEGSIVDLFVGDSFTEGHGASPWFYNLESERVDQVKAVNAGIVGTGPLQWLELSKHLQKDYNLSYRNSVVILIHQDISRPVWNFAPHYITCLNTGKCKERTHPWYGYIFDNSTEEDMERYAVNKYLSLNDLQVAADNLKESSDGFSHFIYRKSALVYYSNAIYEELIKEEKYTETNDSEVFKPLEVKNLMAIKEIVQSSLYQGKILLIPEKHEAKEFSVQLAPKSQNILKWFQKNELTAMVCTSLRSKDFHVNDGHPNKNGYEKIKRCVDGLK
jgi:hypothetical protein